MTNVIPYMSVNGMTAGPDDNIGQGLGPDGERLFDNVPPDHVELEQLRAPEGAGVRSLRYGACRTTA